MSSSLFFLLSLKYVVNDPVCSLSVNPNGKEGAGRDKLNVVVGTDRRGPELMEEHIIVRSQRHQQTIRFFPGVCRRGQYRACKEAPTDQFVV